MVIIIGTLSLWGEDFEVKEPEDNIKKVKSKLNTPKLPQTPEKILKSKKTSIKDKLVIIRENVLHTLGTYVNNTVVIKTREQLHNYIDACIENKIIAVDTETNNSLDPITCKIMGGCIYTPNQKNAYIPINHVDIDTNIRLDWQLTENDLKEEFERILSVNKLMPNPVKFIFHNGKFDYQVIKCTCDISLPVDWDTMIAAKILDENELASLKEQYIHKIDPSIEKYDIEKLFSGVEYAVVDPDLFALYAATDAYMTYKLYLWQYNQFNLPENLSLHKVYFDIELPIVLITADMELTGVCIDKEYSDNLISYYHNTYDKLVEQLYKELDNYSDKIEQWKKSPDAINPIWKEISESEYNTAIVENSVNLSDFKKENNVYYKKSKSKFEQLSDPINLSSPTQLAILLYDILGVEEGIAQKKDKKNPNKPLRGTGEEIIEAISKKYKFPLCELILKNREYLKLINTYVEKIPECLNTSDNRVHTHFNQIGATTGRFSSSDPINLQNIPSHNHTIRPVFCAPTYYSESELQDNYYEVDIAQQVLTKNGWKRVKELQIGEVICGDDNEDIITNIKVDGAKYYIFI